MGSGDGDDAIMLGGSYLNIAVKAEASGLHGGDIYTASQRYQVEVDQWIDLSTGLNPRAYPVGDIPQEVFTRLPYELPNLCQAAADYD